MHHLYHVLRSEAETLCAIRHDVAVQYEEGEKGSVGFRVSLTSGDSRIPGNVRVWNDPDDSLFLVLTAYDSELIIRVNRLVSRDLYAFDFSTPNAFGVGPLDFERGGLLDVLMAKVECRMNRAISGPRQGEKRVGRRRLLNGC